MNVTKHTHFLPQFWRAWQRGHENFWGLGRHRGVVLHPLKRSSAARRSQCAAEGPEEDRWRRHGSAVRCVRLPGCRFQITMSLYGSNQALNSGRRASSKSNLASGMTYHYARSDVAHGGGNGVEPIVEGFNRSATFSRATTSKGSRMMSNTMGSATMGGMRYQHSLYLFIFPGCPCCALNFSHYSVWKGSRH